MSVTAVSIKASEWETVSLGDILTLHYGKALPKPERNSAGEVPVYGANGVKDYANKPLCDGPTLIVGRKGSAGEITLVDGPFWPLDVTYYTSHDQERLDFDYMAYMLAMLDLPSLARGVKPGINRNDVYALEVLLPTLEEQKRIVAILDQATAALDRARAHAAANLADAQKLFESQLDATLSREDNDWSVLPLKSLGSLQTGSTPKTSDPGNFGDDVPFITPAAFRPDGSLDIVNRGLSKQGAAKARMIPRGSALMVCIGATIGKAGFAMTDVVANQQINSISPNDDVSGEFLYYQFITPYFQKELMRRAGQTTLPIVSKGKWSEISVRVPSDLSTQLEVAAKMHEMRIYTERLQEKYRMVLADIADLRQSLLQKAFAGDLT